LKFSGKKYGIVYQLHHLLGIYIDPDNGTARVDKAAVGYYPSLSAVA
jgi:hypothetical protein